MLKKICVSFLLFITINCISALNYYTHVENEESGNIAVRIIAPENPRYSSGAPIIVQARPFFTENTGFNNLISGNDIGAITMSFLYPGEDDLASGYESDGEFDYGGEHSLAAFKDVLLFALGEKTNLEGNKLDEIIEVNPLYDNVGIYAFSHPGLIATNVMSIYSEELASLKFWVGRENPTIDKLSCVEIGHWQDNGTPVYNPYYNYPENYEDDEITINYSHVGWIQNDDYPSGRPYFEVEDGEDYVLGYKIPRMYNARFYSEDMIQALIDNNALDPDNWPDSLATLEMVNSMWGIRETPEFYSDLSTTDMKVMLIFADDDHVHPVPDKPHIHQAYTGFTDAGLWTRLNPDSSYIYSAYSEYESGFPDNDANSEPENWLNSEDWAYPNLLYHTFYVPMAGLAEMADRVQYDIWDNNLEAEIKDVFNYDPTAVYTHIPSEYGGNIGICVKIEEPDSARYEEGAPISIKIPGGVAGTGISATEASLPDYGVIYVSFNFPGSGYEDTMSGGVYDMRGENCLGALRDVILFTQDELTDNNNNYFSDYLTNVAPLPDNLGLIGYSNGGNATISEAAYEGDQFSDLAWIVNWETPVGDGFPNTEAGCTNTQNPPNPLMNPAYNCSDNSFDYSLLAYNEDINVYFNGSPSSYFGGLFYDINQNNQVDYGTDYILSAFVNDDKIYYSNGATEYAFNNDVYPATPPAHISSSEETEYFWELRNGTYSIETAITHNPDLMFIIAASQNDHVQPMPNHPHIVDQYSKFLEAGSRFVRLNPDFSYVQYISNEISEDDAVDNPAFIDINYENVVAHLQPQGQVGSIPDIGINASVCELCDRTEFNNLSPQLDGTIVSIDEDTIEPEFSSITCYPNPFIKKEHTDSKEISFKFNIAAPATIELEIFNIKGQMVKKIEKKFSSGTGSIDWNRKDEQNKAVASGIYLWKLKQSGKNRINSGKLIMVK